MNERIKELAVKAGVTFDWDPGTNGPEVYFDRQEDFEKFAELIVKECHMLAVGNANWLPKDVSPAKGMNDVFEKYFGVK